MASHFQVTFNSALAFHFHINVSLPTFLISDLYTHVLFLQKEQEVVLQENIACKYINRYIHASFAIYERLAAFE